jgi:uncharacterized membrane protein YccC
MAVDPTPSRPSSKFWQTVIRFDVSKITPDIAVRNTIGITLPLIAGAHFGNISAGVVGALGALNVSYSDSRDPYGIRARRMLLASVVVGAAVFLGALSGENAVSAIVASSLWAFGAGMLVVLGLRAGNLGVTTLVTFVVFEARSLTPLLAFETGLVAFAGALLQTVLSLALWPVQPYGPQRQIIATLYRTLSDVARSTSVPGTAPPASTQITDARESLTIFTGDHTTESERYVSLLSLAERIRLSLMILRRLRARLAREDGGDEPAEAVGRVVIAASDDLDSIGKSLLGTPALQSPNGFNPALLSLSEPESVSAALQTEMSDVHRQLDALAGQLRDAARMASGSVVADERTDRALSWRRRFSGRFAKLVANLSPHSTAFRHAVRLAVCVGIGDTIARNVSSQRGYWIPMTIAIILKPDFTSTFSRGVLRLGGTFAGLLIATVLFRFFHVGIGAEITLIAVFTFLLRWIGPANYGVFVTAVSSMIVLLIAITGVEPDAVIGARALNTAFGGALALFAYWIWPTWERTQVGTVLADMLDSYREYLHAVEATFFERRASPAELDRLRDNGRRARSNAEASVDRATSEPGITRELTGLFAGILAASHGFAHAAMAIESALDQTAPAPPRPVVVEFLRQAEQTLSALADALRGNPLSPDLPDLRAAHNNIVQSAHGPDQRYTLIDTETDRIVTSLNTLRELVVKWNQARFIH